MIYTLENHELKHAVEEMLFHLLPTETLSRADTAEQLTEPYCRSILSEENGEAAARAIVCMDGAVYEAEKRASVTGLETLDYKRTITELVKTTVYDAVVPFLPQAPVWGSLTGVRPAKLARGMIERGMTRGEAAVELREHFHVSPERTALTIRAAATAMEMDKTIGENDISLYVGIPFCPSRCYYCSFVSATTAQSGKLIEPYLDTLCREIEETAALVRAAGKQVQSVYIGGGTPTTLDEHQLARLLSALENHFDFSHLREYTVEAGRPDTITPEKLRVLKSAGVGRVSINPQSMNDAVLAAIGRKHGSADVLRAFDEARQAGFDEINMDLIAGLTGDTAETFAQTVDTLLNLSPENITVHTLAIKRGADLTDKAATAAQRETVSQMLDGASHALQNAGYGPYYLYRQKFMAGGFENVGWCKPGTECFYNVSMMEELQTILSLGAGGVSKRVVRETGWIERANNPKYPLEYIQAADRTDWPTARKSCCSPRNDQDREMSE